MTNYGPFYNDEPIKYNIYKKYFMAIQPISSGYNNYRFIIIYELILSIDKNIKNNTKLEIHFFGKEPKLINIINKLKMKCKNLIFKLINTIETNGYIQSQLSRTKEKLEIYKNYKYVMGLENLNHDFYFTEKLYDNVYSNSLTIYFGSPNIHYIFPKLFENMINGIIYINHTYKYPNIPFFNNKLANILINMEDIEYKRRIKGMHECINTISNLSRQKHWEYVFSCLGLNKKREILNNYWYKFNEKTNIYDYNQKSITHRVLKGTKCVFCGFIIGSLYLEKKCYCRDPILCNKKLQAFKYYYLKSWIT